MVKQNSWSKKILVKKVFAHKKILVKKTFWLKKKMVQNVLSFCPKKMGRVNPRGWLVTTPPPPKKIIELKLSWVVDSCTKKNFERKNNGRVNPCGGEGGDDPPEN